jgi:hypothetical protein
MTVDADRRAMLYPKGFSAEDLVEVIENAAVWAEFY